MRTPQELARDATKRAVERGLLVKPPACEKCDEPRPPHLLSAYLVDFERPLDVTWLCRRCYAVARPMKRRLQLISKRGCPDYETMKKDYYSGLTLSQMAKKYGVGGREVVWTTLRNRARAHGEWPLPKPKTTVQVNVIWDLVRSVSSKQYQMLVDARLRTEDVLVLQKAASGFAPRCRIRGPGKYEETWPVDTPSYHLRGCHRLKVGNESFELPVEEAEDWGYQPCQFCITTWPVTLFAKKYGLSPDVLLRIDRGQITQVTFAMARALLRTISEPIPPTLWTGAEREKVREQRLSS